MRFGVQAFGVLALAGEVGQGLFCAFFSDYEKYSHHVNIFYNSARGMGNTNALH